MAPIASLAQVVDRAACDHLAPMRQEGLKHLLEIEQSRLAIDQRDHIHAESVLQRGLLVEVVEHHLRHFAALELDHHPHARLVGLVADIGDALDLFLVDQLGDPFLKNALVHLEGQLVDDDRRARATVVIFEVSASADDDPASPGAVAVAHPIDAVDDAGGGEVGRRNQLDQLVHSRFGSAQQQQTALDHLAQIVRRNVGGHADRDARAAVDQQVGDARRQQQWFTF